MPDFVLQVAYNLIASFVFLFTILFFLRPSIKIADKIASHRDENNQPCFRIKFYNTSLYSGYDVIINLRELEEIPAHPKGKDIYVRNVDLTTPQFPYIPRWLPKVFLKVHAHHCIQVKTFENLQSILAQPNKSLQIRITLRHGLSGLSKNFVKDFQKPKAIIDGEYEFGNCLTIN
jgi:hypothetical protein